jgi:hypothetical protein
MAGPKTLEVAHDARRGNDHDVGDLAAGEFDKAAQDLRRILLDLQLLRLE